MGTPTVSVLIIGNEILSGRTRDSNLAVIAEALSERGLPLVEARVVPDEEGAIVEAVHTLRARTTSLITTGGLGPTHDDITAAAIAQALSLPLECHREAFALMEDFYLKKGIAFNEARRSMTWMPKGARLIENPVSLAPGFSIEGVYALAGVPSIMKGMLDSCLSSFSRCPPFIRRTVTVRAREGDIAAVLSELQNTFSQVTLGSYPGGSEEEGFFVAVVLSGSDEASVCEAEEATRHKLRKTL